MKKMVSTWFLLALLGCNTSCRKELIAYETGDLRIHIEQGSEWLHDFPLFMGIKKKNAPQIAIWIEDTAGNYLSTIYATHRIASQSWIAAGDNRRKEALPHWCHQRGVQYDDGLYLPTKDKPLTDALSGATPKQSFDVRLRPERALKQFVVKIEVNHSTDFNEAYPKTARKGEANYSGGKMGSGQPAVVYAARIDLTTGTRTFEAALLGHSSPDGANGAVAEDVSQLTSALRIVKQITVSLQ